MITIETKEPPKKRGRKPKNNNNLLESNKSLVSSSNNNNNNGNVQSVQSNQLNQLNQSSASTTTTTTTTTSYKKRRGRRKKCELDVQTYEQISGYVENGMLIDTKDNQIVFTILSDENNDNDNDNDNDNNNNNNKEEKGGEVGKNREKDKEKDQILTTTGGLLGDEMVVSDNVEEIEFGPITIYRKNDNKVFFPPSSSSSSSVNKQGNCNSKASTKVINSNNNNNNNNHHQINYKNNNNNNNNNNRVYSRNEINLICRIQIPTDEVIYQECYVNKTVEQKKGNVLMSKKAINAKVEEFLNDESLFKSDANKLIPITSKTCSSSSFSFYPQQEQFSVIHRNNRKKTEEREERDYQEKEKEKEKENCVLYTYKNTTTVYPTTTDILCWWCCHSFTGSPRFIPTKYDNIRQRYCIQGNFCSWECAKAYLMNDKGNYFPCTKLHDFTSMVKKIMGRTINVKSAPPRQWLKCFGGIMTIDEFRSTFKEYGVEYKLDRNNFTLDEHIKMTKMY